MKKQTLKQYFGTIGKMLCSEQVVLKYRDCPFQNAEFTDITTEGKIIEGILSMPSEVRERFPWLDEKLHVKGSAAGAEFMLEAILADIGQLGLPQKLPFAVREASIKFSNRKKKIPSELAGMIKAELWESELEVFLKGGVGTEGLIPIVFRFYPFRGGKRREYYGSFEEGQAAIDAGRFVKSCTGISVDFAEILPVEFPFSSQIRPGDFFICIKEEGGALSIEEVSCRLIYEKEQSLFSIAGISFRNLYLDLTFYRQDNLEMSCYPAIGGTLEIAGIPLSFRFDRPYHVLTVDSCNLPEKRAVSILDAAGTLGFTVPEFLKTVVIENVFLQADIESRGFSACLYFSNASIQNMRRSVSDGLALEWSEAGISLQTGNGKMRIGFRSELLLRGETEMLGVFSVRGIWEDGRILFFGYWVCGTGSFNRIYEEIFGVRIPAQVPVFTVQNLELSGKIGEAVRLERIQGTVSAEIADESLLGFAFQVTAQVVSDENGFVCTGMIDFARYFKMEARALWTRGGAFSWSFALVIENWRVEVSYDEKTEVVTGKLNGACTLGELTDALLRLLNPSDSYVRSSAWSFLDRLSFTGCSVSYRKKTDRMEFSLNMDYQNAFVRIDRLTAALDGNGVQFQIIGNFMGTDYGEENPLTFAPNDPPETTGRGFCVEYMALAKGIETPELSSEHSVEQNILVLKKEWNQETALERLKLREEAGIIMGLEISLASMVKVQLLYQEERGYCGGRFLMDGPKAGTLTGLSAELSYGKLQSGIGVFSGRFLPPGQMKTLSFGAVCLGLGEIEGRVYTNGDFYLDAGFPKNLDFTRSFAISYGIFHGRGGIYIRKEQKLTGQDTEAGWRFGMGLGISLSLGTDYRNSMFSAAAEVIMTGCFEGVYSIVSDRTSVDQGEYELAAVAQFQGILQGNVDFGIIGASVSVQLMAQADVTLSSKETTKVSLGFRVEASATVRVLFVRISFGFSLNGYVRFALGNERKRWLEYSKRERHLLAIPANEEKARYTLRLAPVFSVLDGKPCVNLFLLMEKEDFDDMAGRLARLLQETNEEEQRCGIELFDRLLYFRTKKELYEILEALFIFRLDAMDSSAGYTQDPVMLPLPEYLRQVVLTDYKGGQTDQSQRALSSYAFAPDSYVEKVNKYYEESDGRRQDGAEEEVSITARIFMDFFELLFRSIRAQDSHSQCLGEVFDAHRMSKSQLGNVQGMVNRFLLGGRRGVYGSAEKMRGMFSMSGQQVMLNGSDMVSGYRFRIEPEKESPGWLEWPEKKVLETAVSGEEAAEYFPAPAYVSDIFESVPRLASFYGLEAAAEGIPQVLFDVEQTVYYKGMPGKGEMQQCPRYGGIFWLQIIPVSKGSRVCTVAEYGDVGYLSEWAKEERAERLEFIYADEKGEYHYLAAENLFSIGSSRTGERHMAYAKEPQLFLELTEESIRRGEHLVLSFPEEGNFLTKTGEAFRIFVAVILKPLDEYQKFCTCIITTRGEKLKLRTQEREWRCKVGYGNLLIECSTSLRSDDDAQKRLYAVYNNAGAELVYEGMVSHETPPYIAREENGRREYEIFIPYERACRKAGTPYEMVTAGRPLTAKIFWIDILGNRMEAGREFLWTPVYTDRLIGLWEYEGISISVGYSGTETGLFIELTVSYDPDQSEKAFPVSESDSWKQGILQLAQPDVQMKLKSSVQDSFCKVDKEAVLSFLTECRKNPGKPNCMILKMKLDRQEIKSGFIELFQILCIERAEKLCLKEGPGEIQEISRKIILRQDGDRLPETMHLYTEQERWYVLFTSGRNLVKTLECEGAFGFLPFPAISGIIEGKNEKYHLNGIGFNAVLDDFLADLRILSSPEMLCRIGEQADTAPLLPDIYRIRKAAAGALASRVLPFDKTAEEALQKDVRFAAEQFFYRYPELDRSQLIFVAGIGKWSDVFPMTYRAVIGEGDGFPFGISMQKKEFRMVGTVQTAEKLPAGKLCLLMRHLRSLKEEISYTPWEGRKGTETVDVSLPKELCPPVLLPPDTPALISFSTENEMKMVFCVYPAADTEIHVKFTGCTRRGRLRAGENKALSAMESYRRESAQLLKEPNSRNLKRLTELMEDFCRAVELFGQDVSADLSGYKWNWIKGENGAIEGMRTEGSFLEMGMRISYQTEQSPEMEMEKTEDGYRFQTEYIPKEGASLILSMTASDSDAVQGGELWAVRKGNCENPVFWLSSPKTVF